VADSARKAYASQVSDEANIASVITASMGGALLAVSGCSDVPPCQVIPEFSDSSQGNAACLIRREDEVLAILHRFSGGLDLPGGRSDGGETGQCTAHRETWEETGLNVVVGARVSWPGEALLFECALSSADEADAADFSISPFASIEVADITWVDVQDTRRQDWRYRWQLRWIRRFLAQD
jgi:8-oxo-dGTP diphosphatase